MKSHPPTLTRYGFTNRKNSCSSVEVKVPCPNAEEEEEEEEEEEDK
jgi:hypothetical protein